MQPPTLAPEAQATEPKTKDAVTSVHVENCIPNPEISSDQKESGWLKLNSSTEFDPAGVIPDDAVQKPADELNKTTSNGNFLPQLEIDHQTLPQQISDRSSTTGYQNTPEEATPDGTSEQTNPTETSTSFVTASDQSGTTETDPTDGKPEIPLRILSPAEVAKHNTMHDSWLIINSEVYDVTKFQHEHPGGAKSKSLSLDRSVSSPLSETYNLQS